MAVDRLLEERIARNDAAFREANERISAAAEAYGADFRVPFICECADPTCTEVVQLLLDEYDEIRSDSRWFLTAPGHDAAARGTGEVVAERDGYAIVATRGRAGDVAEALDERAGGAEARASSGD